MTVSSDVLISLSSFGAAEVRRHGQLWFTRLSQAAGAAGVEVRGELLTNPEAELPALADAVQELSLGVVYSSPEGLWTSDGALDQAALDRALAAARRLGAPRLKMSIGGFGANALSALRSFAALKNRLRAGGIELVIENDQTVSAGTLAPLQDFFTAANEIGLFLGMTFDMGNWHWTGECPLQAAHASASQVRYVHCKGVQRQPKRWVAVPLDESSAPWRTILRALPADVPWAIEYPLAGDDLCAVTRHEIAQLRAIRASMKVRPGAHA
jgi:sugar phosphate isomerase/epimerase